MGSIHLHPYPSYPTSIRFCLITYQRVKNSSYTGSLSGNTRRLLGFRVPVAISTCRRSLFALPPRVVSPCSLSAPASAATARILASCDGTRRRHGMTAPAAHGRGSALSASTFRRALPRPPPFPLQLPLLGSGGLVLCHTSTGTLAFRSLRRPPPPCRLTGHASEVAPSSSSL
jgi:hypothetical protein